MTPDESNQPDVMRVLVIEDSAIIQKKVRGLLATAHYEIIPAGSLAEAAAPLADQSPDVILLDLGLPDSDGLDTFRLVHKQAANIPIVIFTANNDDATALEAMRLGAQDYLAKEHVRHPTVLTRALRHAIERRRIELEREKIIDELAEALGRIKVLSGLLPICASCKKIRDTDGYWQQVEKYFGDHSDATFSHGICETCIEKLYPEVAEKMNEHHPDLGESTERR